MAGLAGIVHFDDRPVVGGWIARMLDVVRHRGPDGLHFHACGAVGLGHARLMLHDFERNKTQPVWLPDGTCGLVADARLYNRRELLDMLGSVPWFAGTPTDAEVLLAAYERWGGEVVLRLRGDFAFAAWDGRRGRVFAARDPFGVKPFFYLADRQRICFGSEAKQLLTIPGVQAKPNEVKIAELLVTGRGSAGEATFFENVMRLRPGHWLEADAAGVRIARWWDPAPKAGAPPSICDERVAERFYELFRGAVQRRLDTDRPIALELSGGYDSSSVVLAATELKAQGFGALPKIVSISHLYPGLACDESGFIDAVLASSPFGAIRFDAPISDYTSALGEELWKGDAPLPDVSWPRRAMGAAHLEAEGCRVVLTGLGGDELVWDPDYELDFWRNRQFLRAIRHCLRDPRVLRDESQRESLARLARFAVPRWLKDAIRQFVRRTPRELPVWVTCAAGDLQAHHAATPRSNTRSSSIAQASVCEWLDSATFHWLLESEEQLAAYRGIELRHPFLDQDLVEFVLSIPWQARYRQPGPFKTLLVAAMGGRLPAVLRERHGKTVFDTYFASLHEAGRANLEGELFGSGRWGSQRFIDRRSLETAYAWMPEAGDATSTDRERLWLAAMIELWLRGLPPSLSADHPML